MTSRYPKFLRTLIPALSIALICLSLSSCGKGRAEKLIVAGSNSAYSYVEFLAEVYAVKQPKVNVIVPGGGSSAGIESALTGTSDIGMSSRELFSGHINRIDNQPLTVVTREEGSGTRKSFEESVMKTPGSKTVERISNSALVQDSNGAIREIVAVDPNAISYLSLGLVDKRVKTRRKR